MKNKSFFGLYFTFWLADACLMPFLGLYFEECGFSGRQISVLAIVEAVVSPLFSLIIGAMMSRVKRPRSVLILLPILCSVVAFGMSNFSAFVPVLIFEALLYVVRPPINDIADKLLVHRLGDHAEKYSLYRLGGSLGYGLGAIIGGSIYSIYHSRASFSMYSMIILVTALFAFFVGEDKDADACSWTNRISFSSFKFDRYFVFIYGTLTLYGILSSSYGKYLAIYCTQQGFGPAFSGKLIAMAMVGEIITFIIYPKINAKLKKTSRLSLAFFLAAMRISSICFVKYLPLWFIVIGISSGGGTFAILSTTMTVEIERRYKGPEGFAAQAMKGICIYSLGYAIGTVALGEFYEKGKLMAGYTVNVVIALLCVVLFLLLSFRRKDSF